MSTIEPMPEPGLERLVDALVLWGATASQIVGHMEACKRAGATTSTEETVEAFTAYVAGLVAPLLAGRSFDLEQAADVVEAIDREVGEETFLVPPPNRAERRRRRRGSC